MNLDQLKIFLTVVKYASFTKAAEALYISHSTTSRSVSALEAELGAALLDRDNHSVTLTAAGEILCREGQALLKQAEAVENAVRSAGTGVSGRLVLSSAYLYSHALSRAMSRFCRTYPQAELALFRQTPQAVLDQVTGASADAGVSFSFALPPDDGLLVRLTVEQDSFCAVTALDHPLARRSSVPRETLEQETLLTTTAANAALFGPEAMLPGRAAELPTLESLFLRIRAGAGVAVLPWSVASEYATDCALLDIEGLDSRFDIVLFWRRSNTNPTLPLFTRLMEQDMNSTP